MLELCDVSYCYDKSTEELRRCSGEFVRHIDRVSIRVGDGSRIAIVGRSGCGKTTLLKLACGLLDPTSGKVHVGGGCSDWHNPTSERGVVCLVTQDPDDQIVEDIVRDEASFGPRNLGLPIEEVARRVDNALSVCGLSAKADGKVSSLSGGQRQVLAIASALAMQPSCLLLDEPTSMLDSQSRTEILKVLKDIPRQGRSILHVTHDLEDVVSYDGVYVMENGKVIWQGPVIELLLNKEILTRSGCRLTRWLRFATDMVERGELPRDAPLDDPAGCAKILHGDPFQLFRSINDIREERARSKGFALSMKDAWFSFGNIGTSKRSPKRTNRKDYNVPATIRSLTFNVEPGRVVLILGPTGSGKTTAARLLSGLYTPTHGEVVIGESPSTPFKVGYAFQRAEDQLFDATVIDDVSAAAINTGSTRAKAQEQARSWLIRLGISEELFERNPHTLSGGEKRRVALAGVLSAQRQYVVFDEPTAGLDELGTLSFIDIVEQLVRQGIGVAVVTHDVERFLEIADMVVVLRDGEVRTLVRAPFEDPTDLSEALGDTAMWTFVKTLGSVSKQ